MLRSLPALKLQRSPLILVLGQARISPVLQLIEYVPRIQERLRRVGYPRFMASEMQQVVVGPDATPIQRLSGTTYYYTDRDGIRSVVVAPNFVTLQTTRYDTFDDFVEQLSVALEIIGAELDISLCERIGLRYVDLIIPREGEHYRQYLREGLRGLEEDLSLADEQSRFDTRGKTTEGDFIFRVTRPKTGFIPQDLQPLELVLPEWSADATGGHAVLDFDHSSEAECDYAVPRLIDGFWRLHDFVDSAFRAAVTPFALERWEAQEVG